MGEISEDMLDGTCCSLCGCYFIKNKNDEYLYTHGYPVVCWDCYNDLNKEEKNYYEKAICITL